MRKIYFVLALLIPVKIFSQEYIPLINEMNTWKVQIIGWGTTNTTYFFQGDTVIDGNAYTKLMYEAEGLEGTYLYGFLREDLEEQKVYVRYASTPEELFYDFGVEAGDEVTIYPTGFAVTGTVVSVDTETVNGVERKRINFDFDWYTDSWIEGVGSTLGITNPFSSFPDFSPNLTCFYEGNDLVWDHPTDDVTCGIQLAIAENEVLGNVSLGPNPAIDRLLITFDGYSPGIRINVSLYSLTGDKLVERDFVSRNSLFMDLPRLSDGVYLVRISSGNSPVITRRIMVKH